MADGTVVGKISYVLNLDDGQFNKGLADSNKQATVFGSKFKSIGTKVGAAMAVAGAGLTLISKNATDFTVDYVKSSKALAREIGTSVEEASRLTAVFTKMGISSDEVQQTFGVFAKQITAATGGTKADELANQKLQLQMQKTKNEIKDTTAQIKKHGDKSGELTLKLKTLNNTLATQKEGLKGAANEFALLGIKTTDAKGKQKDFNTILLETADKFKAMPDGVDKTTAAMKLFGRSGKDMIKVLNLGSGGIKELETQADKLGITLTTKNVAAVEKFIQSQKDLKQTTDALKISIGTTTAPVLAAFNTKVNSVLMSLLQMNGPIKTITTDFIAFGGPVMSAVGGLIAFTANLSASKGALGATITAMRGFIAMLTSPWVIAFALAVGALTLLATHLLGSKSATDRLAQADKDLITATKDVQTAQNNLAHAQLDAEQAAIDVKTAQKNYTDAVHQFGAKSPQAIQAALDLKQAQLRYKDAVNHTKDAIADLKQKEADRRAKKKADVDANNEIAKSYQNITNKALTAGQSIKRIDGSKVTVKTTKDKHTGVQHVDFVSTFGKNAAGTNFWRGGLTWVGEKGPELVDLPRGSKVYPNGKSEQMASSMGSSPITIQLNMNGVLTKSRSQLRDTMIDALKAVDERLVAQGKKPILGGA